MLQVKEAIQGEQVLKRLSKWFYESAEGKCQRSNFRFVNIMVWELCWIDQRTRGRKAWQSVKLHSCKIHDMLELHF